MSKYWYLIKNIGILTISNLGSKILTFLLIPLYTSVLTTEEYGVFDIVQTTVALCIPILSVNISSAALRFALDKDKDKRDVFSLGVVYVFVGVSIFTLLLVVNRFIGIVDIFVNYTGIIILMFVSNIVYDYLAQYCRGIEKITEIAIAGLLSSATILGSNILFLLVVKIGLVGYMIAYCLGNILPSVYLIFTSRLWKYFKVPKQPVLLKKEMTGYSKPLVVDTISWWVNNASDRYIVMAFCGASMTGIYSVAYKIPSVLNLFQNIFNQAWLLSAVKENEEAHTTEFYESVYSIYNTGMVVVCSGLLLFNKLVARILFANDFYSAWKYAPFLMISVVFGGMCGLLGGMFSAVKKSGINATSSFAGACVKFITTLPLAWFFDAIGASFATLLSNITVWCLRLFKSYKYFDFRINLKKDLIAYFLLFLQAIIQIFALKIRIEIGIEICFFMCILLVYWRNIKKMIIKILRSSKERTA